MSILFFSYSHPEQPADLDLDTILSFAETDQSEDEDVDDGTGSEACAEDTLFITYKESLLQLLKDCRPKSCVRESCQSPPQEVTKFVGTAVGVKWVRFSFYLALCQSRFGYCIQIIPQFKIFLTKGP